MLLPRIRKKPARYRDEQEGSISPQARKRVRRRLRRPRETDFQIEQLFLRGD